MLKRLWIFLGLVVLPVPALAGEFVLRDTRGHIAERIVPGDTPGRWIRRDPSGKRLGTIEDVAGENGHNKVLRDSSGRRIGTVELRPNGERIVRDKAGHRLETVMSNPSGSDYVRRDPTGNHIGTIEPR